VSRLKSLGKFRETHSEGEGGEKKLTTLTAGGIPGEKDVIKGGNSLYPSKNETGGEGDLHRMRKSGDKKEVRERGGKESLAFCFHGKKKEGASGGGGSTDGSA